MCNDEKSSSFSNRCNTETRRLRNLAYKVIRAFASRGWEYPEFSKLHGHNPSGLAPWTER